MMILKIVMMMKNNNHQVSQDLLVLKVIAVNSNLQLVYMTDMLKDQNILKQCA